MIAQYAPSALWGLALLASFVGWGRLVASALGPRERAHVGLALVWGFAAVLALGGWLCLLGLAERNLLAALVAVGAFRALGYDGLAAVRPERSELLYKLATWTMHADGVRMSWHSDPAAIQRAGSTTIAPMATPRPLPSRWRSSRRARLPSSACRSAGSRRSHSQRCGPRWCAVCCWWT